MSTDTQIASPNYLRLSPEERAAIDAFILPKTGHINAAATLSEQDIALRRENYAAAYLEHREYVYDMIRSELDARESYRHFAETGQRQEDYRIMSPAERAIFEQYAAAAQGWDDDITRPQTLRKTLNRHLTTHVGDTSYQALIEAQQAHFKEPERLR